MGVRRHPGSASVGVLWLGVVALLLAPLAVAVSVDTHYRLGTGDEIRIQVYGEDDLSMETRISDSGLIAYPFIGELRVAGRTAAEVEAMIVDGLKPDYLVNPAVNVSVLEYRQFFIHGEVEAPGGYPFQPGLTVQKAIALGGGFTERASRQRIFVVHDDDPEQQRQSVGLNAPLRPGDTVIVDQSFF